MMKYIFALFIGLLLAAPIVGIAADGSQTAVILNIKSLIYHSPSCNMAKRCTKNCVKTTLDKAVDSGARACKVCGGGH